MQYVALGTSGLRVSAAGLGTMDFGGPGARVQEPEASRIVDSFLDAGHVLIDTADVYNGGTAEEVVGRAVASRRDSVVLATKAFGPRGPGPNQRGLSRVHLTRALEASLRRLGTDYVDLYQCHLADPDTPIEETMATLDGFVRAGKVRYLGCSNFTASAVVEAQWASDRRAGAPLVSLQAHYSLLARDIEAEILPVCGRHGLGVLAYGPLGGGVLAGRYHRDRPPEPGTRLGRWMDMPQPQARQWARALLRDRNFDIAEEVTSIAAALGTSPAAVALGWLAGRPGITSTIVGASTVAQCRENLAGLALQLPAETITRLDEASRPTNRVVTGQQV